MINYLHSFNPQAIFVSLGPIDIYWYGLFVVLGILGALLIITKISHYYQLPINIIFDLSFWLIINGLIGARLYETFLELPYYLANPFNIFKIWEGGLAIHGGIIAGLITIYYFSRKHKIYFWKLCALIVPGLSLGQAIGRFGNYFNQELFGKPTSLPWGIPIEFINRPMNYKFFDFFHPTFLYESLGSLIIFTILSLITFYYIKNNRTHKQGYIYIALTYLILYSTLRFSLEFVKIDTTPIFLSLRWPQFISLIFILFSLFFLIYTLHEKKTKS